jgi:hypothetical protein
MIYKAFIHLNEFRSNLTRLEEYTNDEFKLRVYEGEDHEFPFELDNYACYDEKEHLEKRDIEDLKYPMRACSKRGMLR